MYYFVIKTKTKQYLGIEGGPMYVNHKGNALHFDTIAAANKSRLPSETVVRCQREEE